MSMIGSGAAASAAAPPCTARPRSATLEAVRNPRRCIRDILPEERDRPHMFHAKLRAIAACLAGAAITVSAYQSSPANRPWPPRVQTVSTESPPLSPADALKTFYLPPGYHVELVASEPLIQEPVALDWGLDGRLLAIELPGFMADLTGSNEHDPIGRGVVPEA